MLNIPTDPCYWLEYVGAYHSDTPVDILNPFSSESPDTFFVTGLYEARSAADYLKTVVQDMSRFLSPRFTGYLSANENDVRISIPHRIVALRSSVPVSGMKVKST